MRCDAPTEPSPGHRVAHGTEELRKVDGRPGVRRDDRDQLVVERAADRGDAAGVGGGQAFQDLIRGDHRVPAEEAAGVALEHTVLTRGLGEGQAGALHRPRATLLDRSPVDHVAPGGEQALGDAGRVLGPAVRGEH
jgi:hypothetical protein